jgi:RNA polymerase sigma-70 factor, ECF subfamily
MARSLRMDAAMPSPTDRELLERLRSGEVAAFEEIYRTHHGALCDFAERYVRSSDSAQEIVHDTFLAIWARREGLEVQSTLRAYLFAAVRNRALHWTRHDAIVKRSAFRAEQEGARLGMGAAAPQPDDALAAKDARAAIDAAIALIPPRSRLAVLLRWEHQLSHREVAEAMAISVKGVEKLLAIAMRSLRENIER